MQQTKTVKVFLGSSINELKDERKDISALGDDISNLFSHDNITVKFIKCENLHIGNIGEDDQLAIDQQLRDCELSLFLFRAKAGEWTVHEFEVARALQKEKKHRIFVYFLRIPDGNTIDDSLANFQQNLNEDGVYWKECDDLWEVKFSFAMGVLTHLGITIDRNFPEVKSIGDKFYKEYEQSGILEEQQRKELNKNIRKLLKQIPSILSAKTEYISVRAINTIILYEKANCWSEASFFSKNELLVLILFYLKKYGRPVAYTIAHTLIQRYLQNHLP